MKTKKAMFGGGCFWCVEAVFNKMDGVIEAISGYSGDSKDKADYYSVAGGKTSHREVVQVIYDPEKVSFQELLEVFWRQIDPTDPGGQFADRGHQYTTAIFYYDEEQRLEAEESKENLENSGKFDDPIATEILPEEEFFPAEEAHQRYSEKSPGHYQLYKRGSGRAGFIEENWGEGKD